jgi:hypothetical protein
VATSNQKLDHTHIGNFKTLFILQTNTTNVCQTLIEPLPRKFLAKFEFKTHAAISSNTWQAGI